MSFFMNLLEIFALFCMPTFALSLPIELLLRIVRKKQAKPSRSTRFSVFRIVCLTVGGALYVLFVIFLNLAIQGIMGWLPEI